MSFLSHGVTGAARVITDQPTSNNCVGPTGLEGVHDAGGWIPAIERAILKLSHNPENNTQTPPVHESSVVMQPTAPSDDAPPSYFAIYPENDRSVSNTEYDSSVSRSFQTNDWRDMEINGKQLFRDLNKTDYKMLVDAIDAPDSTNYGVKITLEVAEDQKCSSFYEFLKMFAFVKNYLKFKSEKQDKTVLPESEVRQTGRYDAPVMSQVDAAPQQSRPNDPMGDCCWIWWWSAPPTHGDSCPCCFCCCHPHCCEGTPGADTSTEAGEDCNCCNDCGECDCGDCDCGDCDCGGCDF